MSSPRSGTKSESGRNGNSNNRNQGGRRRWRSKNTNSKNNNGNSGKSASQTVKLSVRELKFHMHGTDANKKAETFEKIKDDIISRVKRTFKDPLDVASSLKNAKVKTFLNLSWVN